MDMLYIGGQIYAPISYNLPSLLYTLDVPFNLSQPFVFKPTPVDTSLICGVTITIDSSLKANSKSR